MMSRGKTIQIGTSQVTHTFVNKKGLHQVNQNIIEDDKVNYIGSCRKNSVTTMNKKGYNLFTHARCSQLLIIIFSALLILQSRIYISRATYMECILLSRITKLITRSYTTDAVWYRQPSGQPTNTIMLNLNWLRVEEVSWQWSVGRVIVTRFSAWYIVTWCDITRHDATCRDVTRYDVTWRVIFISMQQEWTLLHVRWLRYCQKTI